TVHQNLVLRWVRDESLYDVWQRLRQLDLGDAGVDEITDNVSCPGTDSCKLGITSSMGLNKAINDKLLEMDIKDPLTRKINIKNMQHFVDWERHEPYKVVRGEGECAV